MKKVLLWAASALLVVAGACFMTGEADLMYVLLAASPFLCFLSISSLWMIWKWATAPKWNGSASLSESATKPFEAAYPPEGASSEAIQPDKEAISKTGGNASHK